MKQLLSFFAVLISMYSVNAQEIKTESGANEMSVFNIEDYKKAIVSSDFQASFSSNDDKVNFKKLRGYLQKKQSQMNLLQEAINNIAYQSSLELIQAKENEIDRVLNDAKANKLKEVNIDIYFPKCNIDVYGSNATSIKVLEDIKLQLLSCKEEELKRKKEQKMLQDNLAIIRQDYSLCQDQIDTALAPEYKDQEFRKHISIGFTILLGVLLIVFIAVVISSKKDIADYFFSDTGLQFITLFVLIIAIILFGILKILEGRELAAILAGISGYILGKSKGGNSNNPPAPPTNDTNEESKTV
ncbi:MAG: hypothetical protein JNL69_10985 [Bacteroidia bacterium]|nr:hypothetical protein [Bacteroidia bacterium]